MEEQKKAQLLALLSEQEIKEMSEPSVDEEGEWSVDFDLDLEEEELDEDDNKKIVVNHVRFRLTAKIKMQCYLVYSKYKYSAKVKRLDNGEGYKVDSLELKMNSGRGEFTKKKKNVSSISKLEEVYNGGCNRAKLTAIAKKGSQRAVVNVKL